LVHSDGPARAGCQFAWIILIENGLGPFDVPRRNFGGAIEARLGIDGRLGRVGTRRTAERTVSKIIASPIQKILADVEADCESA
jgi:hypothetical protein